MRPHRLSSPTAVVFAANIPDPVSEARDVNTPD